MTFAPKFIGVNNLVCKIFLQTKFSKVTNDSLPIKSCREKILQTENAVVYLLN